MTHNGFYRDLFFFRSAPVLWASGLCQCMFQSYHFCQLPTRLHRVSTRMKLSCWTFVKVANFHWSIHHFLGYHSLTSKILGFPTAFPSVVWALETPSKSALRRFRSLVYSSTLDGFWGTQGETPWRVKSYMEDRKAYIHLAYIIYIYIYILYIYI